MLPVFLREGGGKEGEGGGWAENVSMLSLGVLLVALSAHLIKNTLPKKKRKKPPSRIKIFAVCSQSVNQGLNSLATQLQQKTWGVHMASQNPSETKSAVVIC